MSTTIFLIFAMMIISLTPEMFSFASAMTKGIASYYDSIEEFSSSFYRHCYEFMDEGVMIAAVSDALYSNGTGCGRILLVTCVDDGDICSDSNQVVVKITHHNPYHFDIYLSKEAYYTIVNPGRRYRPIKITYQIYDKDNYTLDTLRQGEALDLSTQQLVSANNLFALGSYQYNYMAIFLRNGNPHPVWIGNRNQPSYFQNIVLILENTGKLILTSTDTTGLSDSGNITLYARQTEDSINMAATLLDSGNLVLRETNSDGSFGRTLWQSFNSPTDTLLPGMKLGINHKTGQSWTLKSWSSADAPDQGALSLEWDPKGRALVWSHRGIIYWTSGTLKDAQNFEFLHPNDSSLHFMYVTNEDEDYISMKPINILENSSKKKNILELVLEYNGSISIHNRSLVFMQEGFCSAYSNPSGCQSQQPPKCRPRPRSFELRSGTFRNPQNVTDYGFEGNEVAYGRIECQEKCWKNCSCVGYSFRGDSSFCRFWTGKDLSFIQDNAGASAPIYVLNLELRNRWHRWIWVIILTTVSLVILLAGIVYFVRGKIRQRGKEKELLELMTLNGYTEAMVAVNNGEKGQDPKDFSYSSIEVATNSFSSENKLGEGGFGPVYKGKLPDGQDIAVKKLSKRSVQGLIEFKTELILIAKLQHTNLVRLFGYCVHRQEKMLIYEYMPNKSLDFFLFDVANKHHLPWERRFNIIVGIAQGLLYLHEYSRLRIVHRDLKASNILLDGNMNPKISDFGLARIFKPNSTSTKTIKIAGTRGYMAPEYLKEGTFSDKSDVFSFGVLVLEIVSGRKANSFYDAEHPMNLITYAWELWYRGNATDFMDPTLAGSCTVTEQLIRCIQIGLLCAQHHASHRPTMSTVVSMLSTPEATLQPPKPPSLLLGDHAVEVMQEDINEVTLSEFKGR